MKRFLFIGAVAFLMSTAANAQIVKSSSNQTIITTKTQVTPVKEKKEKNRYNRIYLGYASTKIKAKWDGGSEKSDAYHGFNLGWTIGRNVTQNKLPIFIETGINLATGFYSYDFYDNHFGYDERTSTIADFEIPVNVTYRYRLGQSKVRIAPYFGFHLKFNVCYEDDEVADNVCRFGLQLGANFDINHFYLGVGWDKDVTPLTSNDYVKDLSGGARLRIGVTW